MRRKGRWVDDVCAEQAQHSILRLVCLQAMYQRFDQGFVGLIFSVFNVNPATQEQTVQLTAFQAVQGASGAQQQQQQLEGASSMEIDGLDDQMRAALAASAAGMCFHKPGTYTLCISSCRLCRSGRRLWQRLSLHHLCSSFMWACMVHSSTPR